MKLSGQSEMMVNVLKKQRQDLTDKILLVALQDLVKNLDPDHEYMFDVNKMEFTKVPIPKEGDTN